jgi:hypothetical protein
MAGSVVFVGSIGYEPGTLLFSYCTIFLNTSIGYNELAVLPWWLEEAASPIDSLPSF